jgi:hypothetical protein
MENIRCCIIISCLMSIMSEGRFPGSSHTTRSLVERLEDADVLPQTPLCFAYEQPPNASLKRPETRAMQAKKSTFLRYSLTFLRSIHI